MFPKPKRRRRRSEMRMGVQSIDYTTTAAAPRLNVSPLLAFVRGRGARLVGLLLLAGLGWGLYILFATPRFFVYGAAIHGNTAVSSLEIYRAGGIDSQNIFWLSAADITQKIEALPNIKSAQVTLTLPARVTITVVERHPELAWQTNQALWWVDEEGTIVPPKENVEGMLRIIDDDQLPVEAGVKVDPTIIRGAQSLRILAPDVSIIRYSRAKGLTVATPEGWPVYLGNGNEIKAKLVVLTALLADLKARNVAPAFIDVRNPLRPVYEPKAIIQIGQPRPVAPGN
jgi:cell division septal protein FtsQ